MFSMFSFSTPSEPLRTRVCNAYPKTLNSQHFKSGEISQSKFVSTISTLLQTANKSSKTDGIFYIEGYARKYAPEEVRPDLSGLIN
jgi:hypothetical protein